MGVLHLWRILEPTKEVCPLEDIANKRLCIDLSYWICQLENVTHGDPSRRQYLRGLFHRVRTLMGLNCDLIFVADGQIPAIKLAAYHHRLEFPSRKNRPALQPISIKENAGSGRRHKTSRFGCMVEEAKALGRALGIPIITSPEEAEAQCAILNAAGLCDICCTGDSDSFLFGATCIMRDMTILPGRSACELYAAEKIHDILGFGRNSLIALGVLLGSDYSPKFRGFSHEKATQVVKASGDECVLKNMKDVGVRQHAKKVIEKRDTSMSRRKKTKENSALGNSPEEMLKSDEQTLASQCVEAYLHPKCHAANSDPIRKAIGQDTKVHLDDLAELLERLLEWPRDTTMNYILPKLAERDLRRSVLETEAKEKNLDPLMALSNDFQKNQMFQMPPPRQYQIAKVLKQHVHYGLPHYKVTWEGNPAVEETIVKAHLLERAYPDKVAEFNALKLQRASKKRSTKGDKEGVEAGIRRRNNPVDDKDLAKRVPFLDNNLEDLEDLEARERVAQSGGKLWHADGEGKLDSERASLLSPRLGERDLFWETVRGTSISGETHYTGGESVESLKTPGRYSDNVFMDTRSDEEWEFRTTNIFTNSERGEWMSPDGERELLQGGWQPNVDDLKVDMRLESFSVDEAESGDDDGICEDVIDLTTRISNVSVSKYSKKAVQIVSGKVDCQQTVEDSGTKKWESRSSSPDDSPTLVIDRLSYEPFDQNRNHSSLDQNRKHTQFNICSLENMHPANFINLVSPSPAKGKNARYSVRNSVRE